MSAILSSTMALLPAFLFYWLILFVACFAVVEYGQTYFYDEATPGSGWRVTLGSALLAVYLTWFRPEYHTMFTLYLGYSVILAIAGFAIFTLIYRFNPWHALPLGVVTVLLFSGMATMGIESFGNRNRPPSTIVQNPSKPLRHATKTPVPTPAPAEKATPAK
jgi:hypothetical protein